MRVLIGLSLLLYGCGAPPSEPVQSPTHASLPLTFETVPVIDVRGHGGARLGPAVERPSPEAREQWMRDAISSGQLETDLSSRMSAAPDWRAMEAAADEILPQIPESMRARVEGDVAERMVHTLAALPSPTPQDLDALGEYTQSLVRMRSTEGDDILRALIRLDGTWSQEQIASAARGSARALGRVFTEQAECVGCTVEEALGAMLPQKRMSMDPFLYEVQMVHRELVQLARSDS